MGKLIKGLNEVGKCRRVVSEEIELNKINMISSKEIRSFVRIIDKGDLDYAMQKIRLFKSIPN